MDELFELKMVNRYMIYSFFNTAKFDGFFIH